jgi:hypothetical protein
MDGHVKVDKPDFKSAKWVKKLITVPEVVWIDNILPVMKLFDFKTSTKDFDVYTYIEIVDFIEKATPGFRTALVGNLLDYIGVELSLSTDNDGKDTLTAIIVPKKAITAKETVKSMMRKRHERDSARNYFDNRRSQGREIEDVRSRNDTE